MGLDATLGIPALAALAFVVTIGWRCRLYRAPKAKKPLSLDDFSIARYEPMERLLAEDDIAFLESQPGYRPEIARRMRNQRREIFRLYLRSLAADFHGLHAMARLIVADAPAEHSGLVPLLLRQKLTFWWAMCCVELRLTLGPVAIRGLDVRGLIAALEVMRLDLSEAMAAA